MDLSKEQAAPFNPRDRAYRRKLWVRIATPGSTFFHVFWGRLAALLAVLAILAWLGLAGAAWAFVKYRRGFDAVSYFDLAFYPVRAPHYRAALGRHHIARGRAELEKKNFRDGHAFLAAGLARVPDDIEARRLAATMEIRLGRVDRALVTLTDGLKYAHHDLDYVKLVFAILLETRADDRVVALAGTFLPALPDESRVHQFVALQAATAHYHRGRSEAAEQLIKQWGLEHALEGQILLARLDWDAGRKQDALRRLENQIARFPRRDELYLELVRLHRDLGHAGEARRYALLRQFNDPASPGPRVDLLHTYRASGDTAAERRELESYLATFSGDANALLLLQWFAVDTVQPALAARIEAVAREKNLPPHGFALARVQVALSTGDYAAAAALAGETSRADLGGGQDYIGALLNAMRAIALFGLGETARAQVMLGTFLENARVRASDALLLAKQLRKVGVPAQARRVLQRACDLDPLNESARAELVRLDAESGDRPALADSLPKLLAMRKHARAVLEDVLQRLDRPSDAPLREQIRAALARAPAPSSL